MTVLGRLFGESRDNPEDPATALTPELLESFGIADDTEAGVSVTPESAYRMTAVYRAIALLSGLIAGMPLHAYERRADGGRERVDVDVISDPNPDLTASEFWEFMAQSLFSHGNAYGQKVYDRAQRVREVWPIRPNRVTVEKRDQFVQPILNPSGKVFRVVDGNGERVLTPRDVLHIPGLSYDGISGMSPVQMAKQGIGLAMAAEKFGARMFDRGALIDGVLQTDQELDEDAAKRLKSQWRKKVTGGKNHWNIPVLDSGAKFERIGLPPADAQYIEIRKFGTQEIARLYGLPPHLLADVERSTSWGTGIEQQNMQMLTFTLDPWLVKIEQRVSRELLLQRRRYVKFTREALLRADTANRFMAYQRMVTHSIANADEIRELEDMDPLPDGQGQRFYRPGNLEPVDTPTQESNDE